MLQGLSDRFQGSRIMRFAPGQDHRFATSAGDPGYRRRFDAFGTAHAAGIAHSSRANVPETDQTILRGGQQLTSILAEKNPVDAAIVPQGRRDRFTPARFPVPGQCCRGRP